MNDWYSLDNYLQDWKEKWLLLLQNDHTVLLGYITVANQYLTTGIIKDISVIFVYIAYHYDFYQPLLIASRNNRIIMAPHINSIIVSRRIS